MNIRYPNIAADASDRTQIAQIRAYLHQLVEQLNVQIGTDAQQSAGVNIAAVGSTGVKGSVQAQNVTSTPTSTFHSIKSLIIKSADIVDAYYERITNQLALEGVYVAQADFPEGVAAFVEKTAQTVVADSTCTKQEFTDLQSIVGSLGTWQEDTKACIKSGLLYYEDENGNELTGIESGTPVYGIEVGQTIEDENGKEIFKKFARFTASGVIFYDTYGYPLVYVTNQQTLIKNAKVEGSFTRGKYVQTIAADGSSVERWVGV